MKQTDPQMKIRLPVDLKRKIEEAAAANTRTMTAEIVARLIASFEDETIASKEVARVSNLIVEKFIEKLEQADKSRGKKPSQ